MTATAYNNLAATYEGMGEYDKAEPLFQKGLKLFEDKLGPNHYKTGAALDNLGVLYREKGEYKKAESVRPARSGHNRKSSRPGTSGDRHLS